MSKPDANWPTNTTASASPARAFYAIACDPRRSVAVEACAGAGKTWMLVSRIVRALLDRRRRAQPHEILAITFTKRAAGEMRERLHRMAGRVCARRRRNNSSRNWCMRGVDTAARSRACVREQLSERVRSACWRAGRPVQIRTFHSWFAALLRSAPLAVLQQLGLPLNYELLEDDAQAVALVWRRFYAALLAQPEAHGTTSRRWCALWPLPDRKGPAGGTRQAHGVCAGRCARRGRRLRPALRRRCSPISPGCDEPEELLRTNRVSASTCRRAAQALGRASAPTFSAKGAELEQAMTAGDMQAVAAALLTQKGDAAQVQRQDWRASSRCARAQELLLRVCAARARSTTPGCTSSAWRG